MEFWGVEVKAGKPLSIQPELGKLIHISQASLGEVKKDAKGTKSVPLRLKIDGKDFIIGTLAPEDRPQLTFDLVFEKEFELSHDWKTGSVYFIGYKADDPISDNEGFFSEESEDESEDELVENKENGEVKKNKAVEKAAAVPNVAAKASKAVVDKVVAKKGEPSDSDDDEDDSDADMALDESLAGDSSDDLSGSDSEDDDGDDSEEEELAKPSKKRPAQAAAPVSVKKAKTSTPTDKTGNKGQNATPNSSKPAGKTPFGSNKSKQSPKSGGQFSGGNKNFNSKNSGKGKRGGK